MRLDPTRWADVAAWSLSIPFLFHLISRASIRGVLCAFPSNAFFKGGRNNQQVKQILLKKSG